MFRFSDRARIVVRSFQNKGACEFRMVGHATQGFRADVAFANVPVTIDARIVSGARVVEVNRAHVFRLHRVF